MIPGNLDSGFIVTSVVKIETALIIPNLDAFRLGRSSPGLRIYGFSAESCYSTVLVLLNSGERH